VALYELAILGCVTPADRDTLTTTLRAMVEEFGLILGRDVYVHDGSTIVGRDKRISFAAVYFGGADVTTDLDALQELIRSSAPIIPTVAADGNFAAEIPIVIQSANGLRRRDDDPSMTVLATALLECVGLLRRQRRVFISYRRVEARATALQLHDLLTARGFEAFLDTHDIRPGDPFQDVLWHRLVDSDVMVMLDTPTYFESRWTREEIGRARAKDIQVLRIIWPAHTPTKMMDLSETIYLDAAHLTAPDGPIADETAEMIVLRVEHLRSRSIAARYMSITGKLKADVEKIGATVEGVGAYRSIALRLADDRKIWAYPVVGVPTAEILNDVAVKALRADQGEAPVVVYDHVGIRDAWSEHLRWLDEHIRVVRAIKVSEAGWRLAAWER
jgi:TIR domain